MINSNCKIIAIKYQIDLNLTNHSSTADLADPTNFSFLVYDFGRESGFWRINSIKLLSDTFFFLRVNHSTFLDSRRFLVSVIMRIFQNIRKFEKS